MEQNIPNEIWLYIFKDLEKTDIENNVSLVCKQWHRVLQELSLIEKKVVLPYYAPKHREKLLHDIRECPLFGNNITDLKIPTYHINTPETLINLIIKSCPNLEKLIFVDNYGHQFFWDVTKNSSNSGKNNLKLKTLIAERGPFEINLSRVVYYTNSTLKELTVSIPFDYDAGRRFAFVVDRSVKLNNDDCFLTTIKLVCPNFMISKKSLNYIISNYFAKLESLDLYLIFACLIPFGGDAVYTPRGRYDEMDWNLLKAFCLSSLKNYNVYLTSGLDGAHLFSLDNCEDENDRYYRGD